MGQDVDATLKSIAATRAALEQDVDELFGRLPEPAVLAARARTYGLAAGGAAVTVGALALRQKKASQQKARRMQARINAEELARAFSPHAPPEDDGGSRTGLFALLLALVVVALTLALRGRNGE